MKIADLDLDKRLSQKEFQMYLSKNRDALKILDNYSNLLNSNPMSNSKVGMETFKLKPEQQDVDENEDVGQGEDDGFGGNLDDADNDPDLMNELNRKEMGEDEEAKIKIKEGAEFTVVQSAGPFQVEEEMAPTEFSACKPWIGVVTHSVPSDYNPSSKDTEAPNANLELQWIHGYRTHDTRNNLRYTANGDIVYHSAAVGIVQSKDKREQKFFFDHIDDIISLAIHPSKKFVATGEIGPYPLIAVWNVETMACVARFNGPLTKGICSISFSPDGKLLVAVSVHDDHDIAVYEWEKGSSVAQDENLSQKKRAKLSGAGLVATVKGPKQKPLHCAFNASNNMVAIMCVREVNFANLSNGSLKLKRGTGQKGATQTFMTGEYLGNTLITGTFKGEIMTWSGTSFAKTIKAHSAGINTIYIRDNNSGFLTGGNDGLVLVWNSKYVVERKISLNDTKINSLCPKARSVCEGETGNILVGTRGGEVLEFEDENVKIINRGHWDNEVWGLVHHPKKDKFITLGQDKLLAIWDIETRQIEKFTNITATCDVGEYLAISPDGKHLAFGSKQGELFVYDYATLTQKLTKKDRKDPIAIVKYSPNGNYLVVGGVDFLIYVYDVTKNYALKGKLKGHVSRVTHIDFSKDGDIIQSNSTSYDILFHDLNNMKMNPGGASAYKDEKWDSLTLPISWAANGIWPPSCSGDDINSCDRDKKSKILATADDFGKVKLFRYPCPVEKASFIKFVGHSSHVTGVRFSNSNKYLISIGGNDKSIFQWKYTNDLDAEKEMEQIEQIDVAVK